MLPRDPVLHFEASLRGRVGLVKKSEVARAGESRSRRQHRQEQDQQREFSRQIRLNHESKVIFFVTILLPVACHFLARRCMTESAGSYLSATRERRVSVPTARFTLC